MFLSGILSNSLKADLLFLQGVELRYGLYFPAIVKHFIVIYGLLLNTFAV